MVVQEKEELIISATKGGGGGYGGQSGRVVVHDCALPEAGVVGMF